MSWFSIIFKEDISPWDSKDMQEKLKEFRRNMEEGIFDPLDEWADEMVAEDNKVQVAAPKHVTLVSGPKPQGSANLGSNAQSIEARNQAALAIPFGLPDSPDSDPEPQLPQETGDSEADMQAGYDYRRKLLEWTKRQGNQEKKSMWFDTIKGKKKGVGTRYTGRKWVKEEEKKRRRKEAKEEIERDRKDEKE